ncbi:MAG: hypothetical protein C0469_02175, partial [Cyanobacteria bacterium DS2.3.42]|nr:hypothetical protein [Cyanobacteria bacterium DS2.3.42]
MTNHGFSLFKSAFTCNSLTNNRKAAGLGQTTRVLALLSILSVIFCVSTTGGSAKTEKTSNKDRQEQWNKDNPLSKLHDSQPREDANCDGDPYVHESKPAPDRTKFKDYKLQIELKKQRKKNKEGSNTGNKGYQNNFDQENPKHKPVPLNNKNMADMAINFNDMLEQIAGAPQQALPNA